MSALKFLSQQETSVTSTHYLFKLLKSRSWFQVCHNQAKSDWIKHYLRLSDGFVTSEFKVTKTGMKAGSSMKSYHYANFERYHWSFSPSPKHVNYLI